MISEAIQLLQAVVKNRPWIDNISIQGNSMIVKYFRADGKEFFKHFLTAEEFIDWLDVRDGNAD